MALARDINAAYGKLMSENRITELEIQLAHQSKQLEELDEVVQDQAKRLDLLEAQMRAVATRMRDSAEETAGSVVLGDQKPPHY